MKYYPRLKIWKSSNNKFDGQVATSYGYYIYAYKVNQGKHAGKFLVLGQLYSPTTGGHINRFIQLVGYENTIRIDTKVPFGKGVSLQIESLNKQIQELHELIRKGRASTKARRLEYIDLLQSQIEILNEVFVAVKETKYA